MNAISRFFLLSVLTLGAASAQDDPTYINLIKQVQLTTPSPVTYYMNGVNPAGSGVDSP